MEEQTKRMAVLVVAALGVVVIVFAGIFYWRNRNKTQTPGEVAQKADVISQPAEKITEPTTNTLPKQQKLPTDSKEAQLKRFCIDFVARYGTYSSDARSMNLQQLMPLMTGDLKVWAEARLADKVVTQTFSGVVTKAVAAKIISQSNTAAVVTVGTQRTYTEGTASHVTYEDATLSLVNSGTAGWRVESVKWQVRPE